MPLVCDSRACRIAHALFWALVALVLAGLFGLARADTGAPDQVGVPGTDYEPRPDWALDPVTEKDPDHPVGIRIRWANAHPEVMWGAYAWTDIKVRVIGGLPTHAAPHKCRSCPGGVWWSRPDAPKSAGWTSTYWLTTYPPSDGVQLWLPADTDLVEAEARHCQPTIDGLGECSTWTGWHGVDLEVPGHREQVDQAIRPPRKMWVEP